MIGIDLGTTNSLVSFWGENGVELITNSFGDTLTPSVVSFDEDGTVYVGKVAKERLVTHPETTFKEFKRNMGTDTTYKAYGKTYTPEDLSALVLKQLKSDAEYKLGHSVNEAVISVPAYFNDHQRASTRNAGLLAGLKVERLINEPSAAALVHHIENIDDSELFIVFDFGGGTLDVSLVDAFANVIEIQAVSGDNKLGGKDFNAVIAYDICVKNGLEWSKLDEQSKAILTREAEQVKIKLTEADKVSTTVRLKGRYYTYELSNQDLINLASDIFGKIKRVLSHLMNDAMIQKSDISSVIMVGGSSKMPSVRQFVSNLFDGRISDSGNPDEIVGKGTGVVCGIKERKTAIKDVMLSDICPFTLGIGIRDDIMSPIIRKNQILPCSREEYYTTIKDDQERIQVTVYQGENHTASKNLSLAQFVVKVPPKPEGEVVVIIRFSYDINGLFDIDAKCLDNKEEVHKEIGNTSGLSKEEIAQRQQALDKIKIHPREMEQNKYILERADRLYTVANIYQREKLDIAINNFCKALDTQITNTIKKAYNVFEVQLALIEASLFSFDDVEVDDIDEE